jgi:hypothetical protein
MIVLSKENLEFFNKLSKNKTYVGIIISDEMRSYLTFIFDKTNFGYPSLIINEQKLDSKNKVLLFKANFYDGTEEIDIQDYYLNNKIIDFENISLFSTDRIEIDFSYLEEEDKNLFDIYNNYIEDFITIICDDILNKKSLYDRLLKDNDELYDEINHNIIIDYNKILNEN